MGIKKSKEEDLDALGICDLIGSMLEGKGFEVEECDQGAIGELMHVSKGKRKYSIEVYQIE